MLALPLGNVFGPRKRYLDLQRQQGLLYHIATTDIELGGLNFLSFSSWFKTLSCLSGLIAFAEFNNKTRARAWVSRLEKDVKAFVSSSKDCKRVCANFERVIMQILVITLKDTPCVVTNIQRVQYKVGKL